MIQELEIQNFQSHEKTVLEFEPGVNVIIGPSDSGKTSIIRALRWLIWNRPLGDDFRSDWGGDTSVALTAEDIIVERFKGSQDHYKLWNDQTEPPIEFKAFGTEVPEEIVRALNLSEINLQEQMDSPFLISSNPGEVSRHFNKVARIDQIDSSLKNVESWIRSIRGNIQSTEKEIERYEDQLADFDYLDKLESEVEILEDLDSRRQQSNNKVQKLNKLITQIEQVERDIEEKKKVLEASGLIENLINLHKQKDQKQKRFDILDSLLDKIVEVENDLTEQRSFIKNEKLIDSILKLYEELEAVTEEYDLLNEAVSEIKEINPSIKASREELDKLEKQWHEEAPDTCPLCDGTGKLKTK